MKAKATLLIIGSVAFSFILAAMVTVIWRAYDSAQLTHLAGRGRGVYMLLYAAKMNSSSHLPAPGAHHTSTEYFASMRETVFADVMSDFFWGRGLEHPAGWLEFKNFCNAWCINPQALSNANSNIPYLLTRNLHFISKDGKITAQLDTTDHLKAGGAVVISSGGSCVRIREQDLNGFNERLANDGVLASDLNVLRP